MSFNIDEKKVKRAGDKNDVPMTMEQASEWMKCAENKYYFFEKYCYMQGDGGRTLFEARPYQRRIIDTCEENRFVVGLSGRQSGKCLDSNTRVSCNVTNKNISYRLELTLGEVHELSRCKTPEEAQFIIDRNKSNELRY